MMLKNRKTFFLFLFILLSLASCGDESNEYIRFQNKSDMDIYVYESYNAKYVLPNDMANLGKLLHRHYSRGRFENYTAYFYPNLNLVDSLFLTVISLDTINKYSWETVRDKQMILRRDSIHLNRDLFKKSGYSIVFYGPIKTAND